MRSPILDGISLCEDVRVLSDEAFVFRRKVWIHELGPAELAVVVFPVLTPRLVLLAQQSRALEVVFLPPQPPVFFLAHQGIMEVEGRGGLEPPTFVDPLDFESSASRS